MEPRKSELRNMTYIAGRGKIQKSRFIAEKILGKRLPLGAVVHHINSNGLNDEPSNLVICENTEYHMLLHLRTRALRATGDPHARQCGICKKWGIPGCDDMVVYKRWNKSKGSGDAIHKSCNAERIYIRRNGHPSSRRLLADGAVRAGD